MGRLGAAVKKNKKKDQIIKAKDETIKAKDETIEVLKHQVGSSDIFKQVKAIPWLKDYFVLCDQAYRSIGKQLSKITRMVNKQTNHAFDIGPKKIADSRYHAVNAYHRGVISGFKMKLDTDPEYMKGFRR